MLLKNEFETGDERYKLLLTETDRNILISLVESKSIDADTRSRLLDNYKYFVGKIADKELAPTEVWESIGKLQGQYVNCARIYSTMLIWDDGEMEMLSCLWSIRIILIK